MRTPSGRGFADYVYVNIFRVAEVYELKPNTIYGNTMGPNQVLGYVEAMNMLRPIPGVTDYIPGATWQRAFNVTLPSRKVEGRTITYWQDTDTANGMIYYYINEPKPKKTVPDLSSVSVPEKEKTVDWEAVGETAIKTGVGILGVGVIGFGAYQFVMTGDPSVIEKGFDMCFG